MSDETACNEPLARYEITEASASEAKWTLSLHPDYFRLEPVEGEPHEVYRSELPERVQIIASSMFLRRVLVVTLGNEKPIFKLSPEAFAAFNAWVGPPTQEDLKLSLQRRFSWVLPIGILFVVTSVPIGEMPWDPISLGLGIALIVTGTLAKLAPHRICFALDSLWFSFLAANSIWLLVHEWSWLQLAFLVLQLALAQGGWREYRRFAPERMAERDGDSGPEGTQGAPDDAREDS